MSSRVGQKPDALPAKMQAAGRSETRIPELHSAYAGRLSRIGSGDREMVDIKCFMVSQVSLTNQKTLDGKQTNQNARVPPHRMQASVNASNGRTANVSRTGRQRLGVIAGYLCSCSRPAAQLVALTLALSALGFCSIPNSLLRQSTTRSDSPHTHPTLALQCPAFAEKTLD
jgi:hypothetical protein